MADDNAADTGDQQAADAADGPATFENSLASLDPVVRKRISDELAAVRGETEKLRGRLKDTEPKAREYDRLAAASKTESEKAQEAVQQAEGKVHAANLRIARAEIRAALAGVMDDADSIVDDLDLARFVDDDGEVDGKAVKALRDKYAAMSGKRQLRPDLSQGSGANDKSSGSVSGHMNALLRQAAGRM